jgi:RNA polymerase sigma-70 factor (ECF subfamily)
MAVIYLVFNEGYAASGGDSLVRADLCSEAIHLSRMLTQLLPAESEPSALLALMLLHDARRAARTTDAGDIVLLDEQDRSRWSRAQIVEGIGIIERLGQDGGPYAVQAAIAAEHARASRAAETDWRRIVLLYDDLLAMRPSPVVELNRAVAVSMVDGPAAGLQQIVALKARGDLDEYYLLWSAEADLLRRLERFEEAAAAYRRALALVGTAPERRFLERRLSEVGG